MKLPFLPQSPQIEDVTKERDVDRQKRITFQPVSLGKLPNASFPRTSALIQSQSDLSAADLGEQSMLHSDLKRALK